MLSAIGSSGFIRPQDAVHPFAYVGAKLNSVIKGRFIKTKVILPNYNASVTIVPSARVFLVSKHHGALNAKRSNVIVDQAKRLMTARIAVVLECVYLRDGRPVGITREHLEDPIAARRIGDDKVRGIDLLQAESANLVSKRPRNGVCRESVLC